jgi:hypothetical protein
MKTINPLIKECNKAINREIAKEFREEAREIILLTTEDIRNEFLKYFNEDNGNICCLVLDKAKQNLIKEGKLELNDNDSFGKPFFLL